ncbi:FkbM family methyltransferase [Delftia acidovorans]|uniref:FkbM family methyltransferase n=1 Tax=Delftia TaxID=80865 RepID=UPI000449B830|nr:MULTISPECIES: FkbM family methyltransferase [Delftia]EZP53434.1 methyltransferase, FkbM family [Delftia sp. RIT313]MCG8988275.1 FkbM family methyltransferase [Delftia acidovorans]
MKKNQTHSDIHTSKLEAIFLESATALRYNPLLGIPQDLCDIISRQGPSVRVFILGSRGFSEDIIRISRQGKFVVEAVVDDFLCQKESTHRGIPLISTEAFLSKARGQSDAVAINTCGHDKPKFFFNHVCRTNGIPHLSFEQFVRAFGISGLLDFRLDDWGPYIADNVERYQQLAQRLSDGYSVQTLYSILNYRLTCDPSHYYEIERPYSALYFRSGLLSFGKSEKMVDCGASVGEALMGLAEVTDGDFAHSWLIEPDRFNIQTLQALRRRYEGSALASRTSIHGCGVGETPCRVPFKHEGGHGSSIHAADSACSEEDMIDVRPIDEIIDDAPSFIKMDVEGAELSALKGARQSLKNHAPKLAISAYHRTSDLLEITDYVMQQQPGYKIGLRHHTHFRWDTCLYFYS